MSIHLAERAVTALGAVALLAAAGNVAVLQLGGPSGIPRVVVDAEASTAAWLEAQRQAAGRSVRLPPVARPPPVPTEPCVPGGGPPAGGPVPALPSGGGPGASVGPGVSAPQDGVAPSERVADLPWLRRHPGVTYVAPRRVPALVREKYRSFPDAWELAQEGGGAFVDTSAGPAYEVRWLDERSYLSAGLGLRPGDRLLAVNGHPIGPSLAAGQALFEALQGERRFAVLVLRDGAPTVLSFYVD